MSKFLASDSLPAWFPLHHFNQPVYNYKTGADVVDLNKKSLWAFVGMVAFNPIFWNIVARNEYRNKTITKVVRSPYVGCYILAVTIFSLSAFRDSLFLDAVKNQPSLAILDHKLVKAAAVAFFAAGQLFVLSSMWVLGVTGTYLGDYFGILMSHRVTGFPFNVLNDPMYIGSFLTHVGTSLWFQSPVGLALSFWVLVVYLIALRYEGPFTDKIYSAAHKKSEGAKSGSSASTATSASTPATPRKSSRIARKSEIPAGLPSAAGSYADAAAETPEPDNEIVVAAGEAQPTGAQTPRRKARQSVAATPGRMTRSRSKGRGLGGSDGDD